MELAKTNSSSWDDTRRHRNEQRHHQRGYDVHDAAVDPTGRRRSQQHNTQRVVSHSTPAQQVPSTSTMYQDHVAAPMRSEKSDRSFRLVAQSDESSGGSPAEWFESDGTLSDELRGGLVERTAVADAHSSNVQQPSVDLPLTRDGRNERAESTNTGIPVIRYSPPPPKSFQSWKRIHLMICLVCFNMTTCVVIIIYDLAKSSQINSRLSRIERTQESLSAVPGNFRGLSPLREVTRECASVLQRLGIFLGF
eukprot:Lankesteria_metandrocarpae@DN4591_c0_g1_i1.p1